MNLIIYLFALYLGLCCMGTVFSQSTTEAPAVPDTGFLLTKQPLDGDSTANNIIAITQSLEELKNGSSEFKGFSVSTFGAVIESCDTDHGKQELYFYNAYSRAIMLMENFNLGMDKTMMTESVFQEGVSPSDVMMAVDWISHNVYWIDPSMNEIRMKKGGRNNDTTAYYVVVRESQIPKGIAVDPKTGLIFWTAVGVGEGLPHLSKASLTGKYNGSIAVSGLTFPGSITLDIDARKLYYTDGSSIYQIGYDGGSRKKIIYNYNYQFYDIQMFQNLLITTDSYDEESVHFIEPETGNEVFKIDGSSLDNYYAVCSYQQRPMPDPMPEVNCDNYGCEDICVLEPEASEPTCLCREGKQLGADKKSCEDSGVSFEKGLILNNGNSLCIVSINMLIDHKDIEPACFFSTTTENETISFFEINMRTREVYFSIDNFIYSTEIDDPSQNKRRIIEASSNILGMSYDWNSNLLYYILNTSTSMNDESIWRVIPSSGDTVLSKSMTGESPRAITVAPYERKVFWITGNYLEGSKLEYTDLNNETGDITVIETSLDLDHAIKMYHLVKEDRLYLLEEWLFGKFISTMTYDGRYIQYDLDVSVEVEDFAVYEDFLILVSVEGDDSDSTLQTASLKDSPPLKIIDSGKFTSFGHIKGVKVLDMERLQPAYPNPCGTSNGGGGCDHICLPEGDEAKCFCKQGFNLVNNTKCVSSPVADKFILFSDNTYNTIFQTPLDDPSTVIGLDTPVLGNPSGVMYEYERNIIYATNDQYADVLAVHLDGTLVFRVHDGGYSYPDRFAYDPSSKLVYFTAITLFTDFFLDSIIEAIDTKGQITNIFLGAHYPRDLALYPQKGYLFYTDHGYEPGIFRIDMDGANWMKLVGDEIIWPNGIAIDYTADRLYWTDGNLDTIKHSNLLGENVETLMKVEGAHLFGLKFVSDYLYYTGANQHKIKRVHVNDLSNVTEYGPDHSVGVILDLDVYIAGESDTIPRNPACATNNGGCSDFCFPTPSYRSCGCPYFSNLLLDEKTCDNRPRCPLTLDTASVNETDTCLRIEGSVCDFHCITNYKPKAGVSSIRCTSESVPDFEDELLWDIDNPCEEILCPRTIDNGTIDDSCNLTVGYECSKISCNSGYEVNPNMTELECLPNGTWKMQEQMCIPKCPDMTTQAHSGFLHPHTCHRDINEDCDFFCERGYRSTVDSTSIACLPGSQWNVSIDTLCEEIMCPDYFDGGFINSSCTRKLKAVCEYSCDSELLQHPTIHSLTCVRLGEWIHGGDDNSDLDILCTAPPVSEKQTSNVAIGVGVGVGAFVLIVIIVVALLLLYRFGRLSGSKSPPVAITSFENPRYAENGGNQASGAQADRSFAYATLEEDKLDTSKAREHVYDNPMRTEQL